MRTPVFAAVAVVVAVFASLAFATRVDAQEHPLPYPQNFVINMSCPRAFGDADATFVLPGRAALEGRFDRLPDQVWIDLSLSDNGFAPGTFIGAGPFTVPLEGGGGQFVWQHVLPAHTHLYRLNGLFGGTWRELGRGSFETPNCGFVSRLTCNLDASGQQTVHFAIPPASPIASLGQAQQQWIDLTLRSDPLNPVLDDGFAPGTFIGAGPFSPSGGQFDWRGIISARQHHYRLNARYTTGADPWVTQFSGSFESLDCRLLPVIQLPL